MRPIKRLFLLIVVVCAGAAQADEAAALQLMLDTFLAGASRGSVEAHERFWADELVYTSSAGTRTNKAEILASLRDAEPSDSATSVTVYTAEDVDIRLYGPVAVVAFRLIGTPQDGSRPDEYFNTGTFLRRDGEWRAIAWQATRIPKGDEDADQ